MKYTRKIDETRLVNSNLDGYEHTGIAVVQGGFHRLTIIDHEADCLTDLTHAMIVAPELLEALEFLLNAADTEPGMDIYKAHKEQARAIINKAKGE